MGATSPTAATNITTDNRELILFLVAFVIFVIFVIFVTFVFFTAAV